tara:strand:+ start:1587 stop:2297 length:711 start_codon:yes stop_codon:yes gene_type:complete
MSKSVYLEDEEILVLSDLHLGFEEYLNEQGIFLPKTQYKKIIHDLDNIFSKVNVVKEVVILGDLKHEFGRISRQEWKEVLDFLDYLKTKTKKIILIKGNHDNILEPLASRKELKIKDYYKKKQNLFLHGDKYMKKIEDKGVGGVFLGHMHPAISIRKEVKKEIYKCFLRGKWKNKDVVILPSFFPLTEGSDVQIYNTNLNEKFDFKLKNFEVFVPVEDENLKVLDMGKVKDVGKLI